MDTTQNNQTVEQQNAAPVMDVIPANASAEAIAKFLTDAASAGEKLLKAIGDKLHTFWSVAVKLDLRECEWQQGQYDWSRRLLLNGQLTDLSISLSRKAQAVEANLDDWLGRPTVYCLVRCVEAAEGSEVSSWINLTILPSMPNPGLIKPMAQALDEARQHVFKRRTKSANKADALSKAA